MFVILEYDQIPSFTISVVDPAKAHRSLESKVAIEDSLKHPSTTEMCNDIIQQMMQQKSQAAVDTDIDQLNNLLFTAKTGNCHVTFNKVSGWEREV